MRRLLPCFLVFQTTRPPSVVQRPSCTVTATFGPMSSSSISASESPTGPPPETVTRRIDGAVKYRVVSSRPASAGAATGSKTSTSSPIPISSPGTSGWVGTR